VLSLALLGPPVVEMSGAPVSFDTRKAVAVLALLALEPAGRTRAALADMLWPESDTTRSRSALRRTLSVIGSGVPGAVLSAAATVRLAGPIECDVASFRMLADARDADIASLERAAALWRGEFMSGFTLRGCPDFDDWQTYQAEELRRQFGVTLDRLVDALVDRGELARAVEFARRRVALDSLHEPAHQRLMRLYYWSDQRSAALRQYRDCVRALDQELGVVPLPDTTALYEAICAGSLAPPRPAEPARLRTPEIAEAAPIVGRDAELAALLDALGRDEQVACLIGPAGVGKTTLLGQFLAAVAARGCRVVATRCHPATRLVPYATVLDLLPSPRPTPGAGAPGAALADALLRLGTGSAPTLLAVDDAQWCDGPSADVLVQLVQALPRSRLMLITCWQPDQLDDPVPAQLLSVVRDRQGATVVELAPFAVTDVQQLLRAAGIGAADLLATRLHEVTGGLPLLVAEHVAAFREGGAPEPEGDWALPRGARAVLSEHLARVSDRTRQVITATAVLGTAADPALLRAVSGRSEEEIVDAIEEGLGHGLLVESPGGDGYDLPHENLRRVVYESASLARRRLLHARAARALAQRTPHGTDAATVAEHFRQAREDAEAAEWAWRAAERATAVGAHAEALDHLLVAGALGREPARVHEAAGDALTALGRYREAIDAYERAAASAEQTAPAGVEHKLAEVHHRLGDWQVAEVHLAAAEALLDEADKAHHARLRADAALLAYRRGDPDAAMRHAKGALGLAELSDDAAARAQAVNVLAVLAASDGEFDDARRYLADSLVQANLAGDLGLRVAALNNLAHLHAATGGIAEAVGAAQEALAAGVEHGDKHHCAALHANLADLLHQAGRDAEARTHFTEAATLFGEVDERLHRPEIWKLVQW
jgi:DNA-binding SARP family transcriptional activator/tetratricopeptide (TPR) repeat protein